MAGSNGTVEVEAAKRLRYKPIDPKPTDPVPIELGDGKEHSLRMDLKAMRVIERETGLEIYKGSAWREDWSLDNLITILWACLRHEDPDLKIEDVEEFPGITLANIPYLYDRIGMLWGPTMPPPDPDEGDDPNPRESSTGSNSGALADSTSDSANLSSGL